MPPDLARAKLVEDSSHSQPSPASKCDSCNKSFYTTMNVKKHVKPEHAPSKPPLQCSVRNKHFPANNTYKHIREEPYHCGECGKSFLNDENDDVLLDYTILPELEAEFSSTPVIQNNKIRKEADLPKSMTLDRNKFLQRNAPILPSAHNSGCAVCGYKATMKESLAKHQRPHTEKEPFACADCGRRWIPKTSWRVHIRTSHTETIRIYANKENCGCSLINRRHTKKHICETCTESLGKEKHLLNHITTIHKTPVILGEATVKQNGLHFKSSFSTAAPILKVYEENSRYWVLCSFCGKQFRRKKDLQKHEEDHVMYRSTDVGNQIRTTQELQRSAPIPSGQSTSPGSRGVPRATLFHLPSMPYTPIRGGEGWLIPRRPTQPPCWKTTPNIDVPANDSTTGFLDTRHLFGNKFQLNDTPRLSQEEELVQDYRSGTTIVMVEEHHHTGLFPTDHRHHSRIRSVLVCTLVDVNITNSTKNDSYPVTHPPGHRYLITVKKHNVKNTEVCVKEFKYRPKLNNSQETNQEPMLSAVIRPIIEVLKVTSMLLMQLKKNREFELTKLSISLRSCI